MNNLPTEKLQKEKPSGRQRASRGLIVIIWLLVMAMSVKGMPVDNASVIVHILADIASLVGMVFLYRRV